MVEAPVAEPVAKARTGRKAAFVAAVLLAAGAVGYFASGSTEEASAAEVADVSAWCNTQCINGVPNAGQGWPSSSVCTSCDPGYQLSGAFCIVGYSGSCSNGYTANPMDANNDCSSCYSGYYLWYSGNQGVCSGYGGSCSNGYLAGQSSRHSDNDCEGCNGGYYIGYSGNTGYCTAYGGSCSNGYIQSQSNRDASNDCGSCYSGYYLSYSGNQGYCTAWGGSCSNGALLAQSSRTNSNQCGSCNAGYYLSGTTCYAWGGSCTNGDLRSQTSRTASDQCASCNTYYELSGTTCSPVAATCANGTPKPAGSALSPTDCLSCNSGYWLDAVPSSSTDSETADCSGACSSGWSNSEITNVGTAGNMHGPWGNDVTSVSKTYTVPSGVTECTVEWDSWGFSSRDSETDYVYVDGALVWSQAQSCGSLGSTTNGAEVQTYLGSYCWGSCSGYTIKNSNSWTGSCSGTMTVLFTSNINQAESDEGWGFNNVVVTYGSGTATPINCAAVATSTGTYTIYPDGSTPVSVWCDMDTDGGGYDSVLVTGGTQTCGSTSSNSCPSGMDIFVPRTQAHYAAIITKYGTSYIDSGAVGVSSASQGPGCCSWTWKNYAMNSASGSAFQAVDGGSWWIRDSSYNEPNGDYTANCWLDMYNVNTAASDMRFNDGWCGACYTQYVCSTNSKDGTLSANVGTCNAYAGSCSNGALRAQASRSADNQCGSCNAGYYLSGTTCYGWGGSCSNGSLRSQTALTAHDQCQSCNAGYYLSGTTCLGWGGSCTNGYLFTQTSRTMQNHCQSCYSGYYLVNGSPPTCAGYAGSCSNGALISQSYRVAENHCGSCNAGYYLSNRECLAWGGTCTNGVIRALTSRTAHNQCQSCDDGYYLSGTTCYGWGGSCTNGVLRPQAERTQNDHCGSCDTGYELGGTSQPDDYAVSVSGLGSYSTDVMGTGAFLFSGAGPYDESYVTVPGELDGSLMLHTSGAFTGGTVTVSANYASDMYVMAQKDCNAFGTALASQDPGWTPVPSQMTWNRGAAFEAGSCTGGDITTMDGLSLEDCKSACIQNADCTSIGFGASPTCESGADADGWSNSEITFGGTAGNLHGPWGNDVREVSKTYTIPSGVTQCTVSWTSWGFSSRDNEYDRLYIDGTEVWSQRMYAWGAGSSTNSQGVMSYLGSYCWGSCSSYTIKYDQTATVACADTLTLRFQSDIDQGESDEGWAFSNVCVDTGVAGDGACSLKSSTYDGTVESVQGFAATGLNEDGAVADGWSDSKITNVGTRGNVHGPWGNDVKDVSKVVDVPAGTTQCTVSWKSFSLYTRDNEADKLYVDGTEVWTKNGNMNWDPQDGPNWASFSDARGYAGMYEGSVTAACSAPSMTLRFTSAIDQAIGDEGWAFSDVSVSFGGSRRLTAATDVCYTQTGVSASAEMDVFRITMPANQELDIAVTGASSSCFVTFAADNTGTSCAGCGDGYYLVDTTCTAWAGECANGALLPQVDRRQENHCGSCDNGYWLNEGVCVAYAGSCTDGTLAAQAERLTDDFCGVCNAGYQLVADTYTPTCQACQAGSYSVGTEQCTQCAPGRYQNQLAQTECIDCAPGYIAPTEGYANCHTCGADGMEPNAEQTACSLCTAGSVATDGMAACVDCTPGYYAATEGMAACDACAPGYIQPNTAATDCVACGVGKRQPSWANTVCYDCSPGKFQDAEASTYCDACVPGTVQPATGTTVCNDCEIGYYQGAYQQTSCPACTPGNYAPTTGSVACTTCEAGKQQHQYAQGACIDCAPGHVAPITGMVYCNECVPGEHQDEYGQLECKACKERQDTCDDDGVCDLGTWTGWNAAVDCVDHTVCPPATHIDFEGSLTVDRTCKDCAPEHWNPRDNNPTCTMWTICPGSADADYDGDFEGLAVLGTNITDAVCETCEYGKTSLIDDFYSPCYSMTDIDGDGKFDRFIYDDLREQGERAASLDRTAFVAEVDYDKRAAPGTGGEYDRCPFDGNNDEDGDGICHGPTPFTLMHFVDDPAAAEYYEAGGSRNDLCPKDPTNDVDKDGWDMITMKDARCDEWDLTNQDMMCFGKEPIPCKKNYCDDTDKLVQTMNFYSNNKVGWTDEDDTFMVMSPPEGFPSLGLKMFSADRDVDEVCLKNDEQIVATFTTPLLESCDDHCAEHGMVCEGGAALLPLCTNDCGDDTCGFCDESGCCDVDLDGGNCNGKATCKGAQVDSEFFGHVSRDGFCDAADQMSAEGCAAQSTVTVCTCVPDTEPVKTIHWSQQDLCPSCYVCSDMEPENTGSMTTEFKIKKDTLSFAIKAPASQKKYVKLTVKNQQVAKASKALVDMPSLTEYPSSTVEEWYPVEWDLSMYIGEVAVIEIGDYDMEGGISVDDFVSYKDHTGCLPSCMSITFDVGASGETQFFFEGDRIPYVRVKSTGENDGTYCRSLNPQDGGPEIGPVLETYGLTGASGFAAMNTLYLGYGARLPRCLNIDMRVSFDAENLVGGQVQAVQHFGISIASGELGSAIEERRIFAFESEPALGENAHCVYPSLKPRCVDRNKPTSVFTERKRTNCRIDMYSPSCLDQCYNIHCPIGDVDACGAGKAFDDCAACCDSNDNVASGCFRRRRRRLGDTDASQIQDHFQPSTKSDFTNNECAAACLAWVEPNACIGYMNDDGICMLTTYCNNVPDEMRPEEERGPGHGNFERATWSIVKDIEDKDLYWRGEDDGSEFDADGNLLEPQGNLKKRKRKRKKKGTPVVVPPTLVGGERDENGCIGSAGFQWCEPLAMCIQPWMTDCVAPAPQILDGAMPAPELTPIEA